MIWNESTSYIWLSFFELSDQVFVCFEINLLVTFTLTGAIKRMKQKAPERNKRIMKEARTEQSKSMHDLRERSKRQNELREQIKRTKQSREWSNHERTKQSREQSIKRRPALQEEVSRC